MILTSTTETVPHTPSWRVGQKGAPIFHLRAGSIIERGQMEAELTGQHRAGKVWAFELRHALICGVNTLFDGDPEQGRILELNAVDFEHETEKAKAAGEGTPPPPDPLTAEDRQLLVQVRTILAEHWPDYRELLAQIARRGEIAPIVALKRFCTGWDNAANEQGVPASFATTREGLVTDAALRGLSALEMIEAGNRAFALQYGGGEEKNSSQPSTSDDGPQTSSSDGESTVAGTSTASAGKKIPASRSPRGSGQS